MAHGEWAECPVCGKLASSSYEIEQEFGYRYDGTTPQSWCKKCRALGNSCKYTDCPVWNEDISGDKKLSLIDKLHRQQPPLWRCRLSATLLYLCN